MHPATATATSDLESKATEAFIDDDFELAAELYDDRDQAHIKLESYIGWMDEPTTEACSWTGQPLGSAAGERGAHWEQSQVAVALVEGRS